MASRSLNRVTLIGRLGRDADTKFTPSGAAKTTFTVATDSSWKDKQSGEWKTETQWHNICAWRQENVANYLTKGTQVYVEGKLTSRSYDDRDGNKKYITEVVADSIILLGGKQESRPAHDPDFDGPRPVPAPRAVPQAPADGITDDDVPF